MLRILFRWRRWIIFGLLLAATGWIWWVTEPRPEFTWVYEKSQLADPILEPLKLESASPDGHWLVIRRIDKQNDSIYDFVDLTTHQTKRTWKRNDTESLSWDDQRLSGRRRRSNNENESVPQYIERIRVQCIFFDLETGQETTGSTRKQQYWRFSVVGQVGDDYEARDEDRKFSAKLNSEQQLYEITINPLTSYEIVARLKLPLMECRNHERFTAEIIPQHSWIVVEGASFLSEFCSPLLSWLHRIKMDHCRHELRMINWQTSRKECFYQSWGRINYLLSPSGFIVHHEFPSNHIIEFWPWPVAQRNWWWLLVPWGGGLVLWIAARAMKRNNRVAA